MKPSFVIVPGDEFHTEMMAWRLRLEFDQGWTGIDRVLHELHLVHTAQSVASILRVRNSVPVQLSGTPESTRRQIERARLNENSTTLVVPESGLYQVVCAICESNHLEFDLSALTRTGVNVLSEGGLGTFSPMKTSPQQGRGEFLAEYRLAPATSHHSSLEHVRLGEPEHVHITGHAWHDLIPAFIPMEDAVRRFAGKLGHHRLISEAVVRHFEERK